MMDEAREEEVLRYVLGEMAEPEAAAFRAGLARDEELRTYVRGLESTLGSLALSTLAVAPPPELLGRILAELQPSPALAPTLASRSWLPWALAACLAVACTVLGVNHVRLRNELVKVRHRQDRTRSELVEVRERKESAERDLAAFQQRDELAQVKIATLTAQVEAYAKVAAVVVWNAEKQRGVVKFDQLPPLDAAHDYQLWVIESGQPKPISAGLVAVGANGSTQLAFQPVIAAPTAAQFALSIEPKGGGSAPQGQVVLAGK